MILIISFRKFCVSNLFIMLNSLLQKASTGVNPYYLDVWQLAHLGNVDATEKLISISFYSYTSFVISVFNSIFCRTDPQDRARRPEVSTFQCRHCGRMYPA
jgi:hypothetical protein